MVGKPYPYLFSFDFNISRFLQNTFDFEMGGGWFNLKLRLVEDG
jgi:hypothetical protein